MGRLNFGNDLLDVKGIISNVTLNGQLLSGWTMCLTNNFIPNYQANETSLPSEGFRKFTEWLNDAPKSKELLKNLDTSDIDFSAPSLYVGDVTARKDLPDTFLNNIRFTKGVALLGTPK